MTKLKCASNKVSTTLSNWQGLTRLPLTQLALDDNGLADAIRDSISGMATLRMLTFDGEILNEVQLC